MGLMMHVSHLDLQQHADLWEGLKQLARHVEGPDDVTVGEHWALGLCIVSHYGHESHVTWTTAKRIELGITG